MTERFSHPWRRAAVAGLVAMLLSACGAGLEGTYADGVGLTRYTFRGDGTVTMRMMGTEVEVPYEVEGDKVKVGPPDNRLVLTRQPDGSLEGPLGVKLTRQQP